MKTVIAFITALLISVPAIADDTAYIQSLVNTSADLPCGTFLVNGTVTVPVGGAVIQSVVPKCTFLHVTSNVDAISCSGVSAYVKISGIVIFGSASTYTGAGTGATQSGQNGVTLNNCSNFLIEDVSVALMNGNAIDCSESSSSFNGPWYGIIRGVTPVNDYKGIYTHLNCEYVNISEVQGRQNVFCFHIASGNINATNNDCSFNTIGAKVEGNAVDTNPGHGTISSSSFNHNTYNAIIQSVGIGETFANDNFIGDQSSVAPSGASAGIQIYNSHGVSFVGGQLGTNVTVTASDPVTGSAALNGENLISQMYVRTDLSGFTAPTLNLGTTMLIKGNFDGAGLWSANN